MTCDEIESAKQEYAGKWICIHEKTGEVITHGKSLSVVFYEAKAKGIKVPRVIYVEPKTAAAKVGL